MIPMDHNNKPYDPKMKRSLDDPFNVLSKTISVFAHTFDIFGSKLYVIADDESLPYIKEYIESVKNGTPDKEGIIKKYMQETEGMRSDKFETIMKKFPNILMSNSSPARISSYLNQVERDLKPILEALVRDKKIDDLLGDSPIL